MKRMTAALLILLFLTVACADDGVDSAVTETSDTATTEDSRDFATRVGDSVGTATSNADELRQEENERVDEVNEAMDE
jgi:hypothetical protein